MNVPCQVMDKRVRPRAAGGIEHGRVALAELPPEKHSLTLPLRPTRSHRPTALGASFDADHAVGTAYLMCMRLPETLVLPPDPEPPRPPRRWRRSYYFAMLLSLFTALELWAAAVTIAAPHLWGVSQLALALILGGTGLAVIAGWRYALRLDRQRLPEG
jgi:hypothetical protein